LDLDDKENGEKIYIIIVFLRGFSWKGYEKIFCKLFKTLQKVVEIWLKLQYFETNDCVKKLAHAILYITKSV